MTHLPIPIICGGTQRGSFFGQNYHSWKRLYTLYDSIMVYSVSKHIITDVFVEKRKYKTFKFQVSRSSSLFVRLPSTYEVVSL